MTLHALQDSDALQDSANRRRAGSRSRMFRSRLSRSRLSRSRLSRSGTVALVGAVALVVSACGQTPGTEVEFAELLEREGTITKDQSECIAAAVFEEYGDDEAAMERLSFAETFDDIEAGDNPIAGFTEFYNDAVGSCLRGES